MKTHRVLIFLNYVVFTEAMAMSTTTTHWVNAVPGYSSLASCAEVPLSTLVRDMDFGCGDGGRFTSFNCFCTTSYSTFVNLIYNQIVTSCGTAMNAEATSALAVFSSYCAEGDGPVPTVTPTLATPTGSASSIPQFTAASAAPGSTTAFPSATSSASPTSTATPAASTHSHKTTIALAVALPLAALILASVLSWFCFLSPAQRQRRHASSKQRRLFSPSASTSSPGPSPGKPQMSQPSSEPLRPPLVLNLARGRQARVADSRFEAAVEEAMASPPRVDLDTAGGQMGGQAMGGWVMGGQAVGGQTMDGQAMSGQMMGRSPVQRQEPRSPEVDFVCVLDEHVEHPALRERREERIREHVREFREGAESGQSSPSSVYPPKDAENWV